MIATAVFVLGCVLAGDHATIDVDVDALALPQAQTEQLHGELMTRLVESGHAVGSAGAITVRLTGGGQSVHVEVQHGKRAWRRDVVGDGALLRLATIHAALDLLTQVDAVLEPDPVLASTPERSVVVESSDAASGWLPEVIAALVDADHVVKPSAEGATWKVCVGAGDGVTLAVVEATDPCPAGVPSERLASDLVVALADARAKADAVALADARAKADAAVPAPVPTPAADDVPVASPVVAPVVRELPAPARAQPWSGALGLGLGVQARLDAEPLVVVHGDARHDRGAMITLRAELAPFVDGPLRVVDTFITAGAGYGFAPHPRLRVEVLATVGVAVHGFRYADEGGVRGDFTAALPVTLAIVVTPRLEVGLSAQGGVSTTGRRHLQRGQVLWTRDQWRIAGVVALRVVLGRKPSRAKMAGQG